MVTKKDKEWASLELQLLPNEKIRSHYRDGEPGFPSRLGMMHPLCAEALIRAMNDCDWSIVLTDAWRASLVSFNRKYPEGKKPRRGTQPPAFSGHNYGFSIDIDVSATLELLGWTKAELDEYLKKYGLYCHRKDSKRGHEDWHYNALVVGGDPEKYLKFVPPWRRTTSLAVERMIQDTYGDQWVMSDMKKQRYLKYLKLYPGKMDGKFGPMSKAATRRFQAAWKLKVDGICGPKTCRLLWFRCAELEHPLLKDLWTVKR